MNSETPTLNEGAVETKPADSASKPSRDLSTEIAQKVDRHPGDRVRVVRVYGDNYRCNWIAPKNRLDVLETFVVRQSQFLNVIQSPDGSLRMRVVGSDS